MTRKLQSIGADIWVAEKPFTMGALNMGARMTIVRLRSGGLFLLSPIAFDDELGREISPLGPVEFVVAPNQFHHIFVKDWLERFPAAKFFAVPELVKKRPDLRAASPLTPDTSFPWDDALQTCLIKTSPKYTEAVFFHPLSRTLILTDLALNLPEPRTLLEKLGQKLLGAYHHFGPTRYLKLLARDRKALRRGLNEIERWPFERIVIAHGQIVTERARERLSESYAWLP